MPHPPRENPGSAPDLLDMKIPFETIKNRIFCLENENANYKRKKQQAHPESVHL